MTEQEFAFWQAKTDSSHHKWTEDEIYRLNGHGALYYIGGENGRYMRIGRGGLFSFGTYEGAVPHIGEALFKSAAQKECRNFNEAFETACRIGGKKFLADMFSGGYPFDLTEVENPSVIQTIKRAHQMYPDVMVNKNKKPSGRDER